MIVLGASKFWLNIVGVLNKDNPHQNKLINAFQYLKGCNLLFAVCTLPIPLKLFLFENMNDVAKVSDSFYVLNNSLNAAVFFLINKNKVNMFLGDLRLLVEKGVGKLELIQRITSF